MKYNNKLSFFSIIFLFLIFLNSNLLAEPTHVTAFNTTEGVPTGVTFNPDGTRMYVIGINNDTIRQYTLSTGFDLSSTVTLEQSVSITSLEGNPQDIAFNSDGTVIFIAGTAGNGIDSWSLSTAYDISSMDATDDHIAFKSVGGDPRDLAFNSDGTKMFILNGLTEVKEYALSTAYDPDTLTLTNTLSISLDGAGQGMGFSSDGKKMFLVASSTNKIHLYNLTSGFDLSDVSYFGEYSVNTSASMNISGLAFNSDGTKMFHADFNEDEIQEYSLSCRYGVVDCEPTLSSSSPADGATGVGVNDNIILTFSEAVDAESGNIVIKKSSDDSIVETIDVTGSKVSGSGSTTITIDPSSTLDQATGYYITIDATAFDDASSISYAGISDATTLNFNTGASDPLADKDVVGSIEAQVDVAKQIIHHSTIPVLHRMEWLRRHSEENDLSHQGIKVSFANPMFTSISSVLPVSTYFNPTAEVLHNDWAIWTKGSVTIGKTSGTDSASLKDFESTGITIGADKKVGLDLVHGFALRFGRDDVDVGSSGTSLDTDSYSLSIYRTHSYNEKTFLDSLLGISTLKTDLIRKSGANTLTGRRYGRQIFGSLSYSGVLNKDQFNFSPSVRLDVGYTNLSSYSETGKDALAYDAHNIRTGKISTGVLLDDTIEFSSITLRPNGRLEYGADFSPSSNATLSYVSDPSTDYTLSVSKRALHNFRAGFGLDIKTVGGLSVITSYEKNRALDSSYSDTVRLGISYHHSANTQYALSFDGPDSSGAIFDVQTTSSGFNVNFKLEYSATGEMPHQVASLSLVKSF
jgi:sugar lactone lactonase YvrE